MLTAGIILGVMVIPFISSVMRDVFALVPTALREAAFAVGATRAGKSSAASWCPIRGRPWSAAFSRPRPRPRRDHGSHLRARQCASAQRVAARARQFIAAAIANEFTEADSDIYLSSLIALGFCCLSSPSSCWRRQAHAAAFEPQEGKLTYGHQRSPVAARSKCSALALATTRHRVRSDLAGLDSCRPRSINGLSALNLKLFTEMTPPPGSDGGLLNAIYGSAAMIVVAVLLGAPIGILAGTSSCRIRQGECSSPRWSAS